MLILIVSLYTSKVVLQTLGVEDFGIYNVVGGVVTMMAFLSGAMSSATQRFISFELGKGDEKKLNNLFKMSVNIHILIILIVVLVAETVGLWFVNTQLVIPTERMDAANWVFQCALLSFCISVIGVPYNAVIIAYEKMSVFACFSIVEALLKLGVVFLLASYSGDRLKYYSALLVLVSLASFCFYYIYAKRGFSITHLTLYWNGKLFNTLFSYTGWNLFGSLSVVVTNQGVNIILNLFFGTPVNAARAIAFQVNGAITGFVSSLQMAINPQIIKSYATQEYAYMHQLIMRGSKYTFFLMYALALPVLWQTEFILNIWLVNPPQNSVLFCKLVLIDALITTLSGSLIASAQATGKIKLYQVIVGGVLLCNLPVSYFILSNGGSASATFYVSICTSFIALLFRLVFLRWMIRLNLTEFFNNVIGRAMLVVLSTLLPIYFIDVNADNDFIDFILMTSLIMIVNIISMYFIGLERLERDFIKKRIIQVFS
ncbi:hypothetical protein ACK3Z9_20240 [Aeromonas caviae]